MAGNKLTIKLTDEQQKQILDATGKNMTELSIDSAGVSDKDLDNVSGGAVDSFLASDGVKLN